MSSTQPQNSIPFQRRHIGPGPHQISQMLAELKLADLQELIDKVVPQSLLCDDFDLPPNQPEMLMLEELQQMSQRNTQSHNMIGLGYHDVFVPPVLEKNLLQSPGWYTAYTPYQAEVSQGRLEMLLNFQQMVTDLTQLDIANASLLDEATAAAEAVTIGLRHTQNKITGAATLFADHSCLPQTLAVLRTRAEASGVRMLTGPREQALKHPDCAAYIFQYPGAEGDIADLRPLIRTIKAQSTVDGLVILASDPLALTVLQPPGELGADCCIGSSQRISVPIGYGGPHAAFIAVKETYQRLLPGRIIGVSRDSRGRPGLRMALQTREQHIRREKATSNICTAQSLLANLAAARALYEGAEGLHSIANTIHQKTCDLAGALSKNGLTPLHAHFFDTLTFELRDSQQRDEIYQRAQGKGINLRKFSESRISLSVNEMTQGHHLVSLYQAFTNQDIDSLPNHAGTAIPANLARTTPCLSHDIFSRYRSETEMVRYLKKLERRDITLDRSMIGLGSCTMKLNAAAEMSAISWPGFANIHPFAPSQQTRGYLKLIQDLSSWLAELTGFDAVSMQPNSGAQGEYAGLLTIRNFHLAQGNQQRTICLIPRSAHGTNPASAVMAGMKVVVIDCDANGSISLEDLELKLNRYPGQIAALMLTYPSTHGVFEPHVAQICQAVHAAGGRIYLDGANFNAMLGLIKPRLFGADICHLNLHKTFAIPHGGGGPGMGPVATTDELAPYLPGHPSNADAPATNGGAVSAAPFGSAGILPISWAFIRLLGADGMRRSAEIAILNANWLAQKLTPYFPVLYTDDKGYVAHECILDIRPIKAKSGVTEEDIAKRLADFGYHAPTISFPVAGTMMIEPTESESLNELERFCRAMIKIRGEIDAITEGRIPLEQSPLRLAPHTELDLIEDWNRPYTRQEAIYPLNDGDQIDKYWPPVNRIDNVWGDRNLFCSCLPVESWGQED
ncbi:MAG: aminomethyl-transferring glycine dehydrogenase [Gammaproteobacteria bacterium]